MKNKYFFGLVLIVSMLSSNFAQAQSGSEDSFEYEYVYEDSTNQPPLSQFRTDMSNVIFGVLNLSKTVGYDQGNGLYAVAILQYDTVYDENTGTPVSVMVTDHVVNISSDMYEQLKSFSKLCYVHAKWTVRTKKNGYRETSPPKNPLKPGNKICLVYQFGDLPGDSKTPAVASPAPAKPVKKIVKKVIKKSTSSKTSSGSGTTTHNCPAGKEWDAAKGYCVPIHKSSR